MARRESGSKPTIDRMVRDELVAIYTEFAPDKLSSVPMLCDKWKGREAELLQKVRAKYAPLRADVAPAATQSQFPNADTGKNSIHDGSSPAALRTQPTATSPDTVSASSAATSALADWLSGRMFGKKYGKFAPECSCFGE